jgi:hypothetical protein
LFCFQAGHLGNDMLITMKLSFILVNIDMFLWKWYYIGNTFSLVALVLGRLSCKFHGGYHGDIVVLVSCSRQVTGDNFEGSYSDGCRRQHIRWPLA